MHDFILIQSMFLVFFTLSLSLTLSFRSLWLDALFLFSFTHALPYCTKKSKEKNISFCLLKTKMHTSCNLLFSSSLHHFYWKSKYKKLNLHLFALALPFLSGFKQMENRKRIKPFRCFRFFSRCANKKWSHRRIKVTNTHHNPQEEKNASFHS